MSRAKRLRTIRKEKIKAAICGLVMSLSIGFLGALGSYSWFTDSASIENNQQVTIGNLKTVVTSGFSGSLEVGSTSEPHEFTIYNDGTLDQRIKVKFVNNGTNVDLNKVKYTLLSSNGEKLISNQTLSSLFGEGVKLTEVIDVEGKLECKAIIEVDENLKINNRSKIDFNMIVDSEQVNVSQVNGGGK